MYGTVVQFRAKPGMADRVVEFYDRWYAGRRPHQVGWQAAMLYQSGEDPHDFALIGAYIDRQHYEAGTTGPAAEPWVQDFFGLLEDSSSRVTGSIVRQDRG